MPEYGLQNHDGVIDQQPNPKHQTHHGQDVQRPPPEEQETAGAQHREGDRNGHDQGGGHSPEKEIQDANGEQGADQAGLFQAVQAVQNLFGLIEKQKDVDSLHFGIAVDPFQHLVHFPADLDRVGPG